MGIIIKYFGKVAEITGTNQEVENNSNEIKLDELNKKLVAKYPQLLNVDYKLAINQEFVSGNPMIKSGEEIALLPPFAGG